MPELEINEPPDLTVAEFLEVANVPHGIRAAFLAWHSIRLRDVRPIVELQAMLNDTLHGRI